MSDDQPDKPQGTPQAGVLGNLPSSRPAVRSPRRRTEPQKKAPESGSSAPAEPSASSKPHAEPKRSAAEPEPGGQAPDLEALARGGIAVAGEAASLGLRLAGRAAAALRDAVERR